MLRPGRAWQARLGLLRFVVFRFAMAGRACFVIFDYVTLWQDWYDPLSYVVQLFALVWQACKNQLFINNG